MSLRIPIAGADVAADPGPAVPEEAFAVPRWGQEFGGEPGLTFLILARDEAPILARTLTCLGPALGPRDRIHVVADQCRDATAAVAARGRAVVHVRTDGEPPGKGPAIRWWLERTRPVSSPMDPVVILDADSLLAPGFVPAMRRRMAQGEVVIQAAIAPEVGRGGAFARLAALSDIVEQQVFDAWSARRQWPLRLRGTGTAFRRWALERAARGLQTSADDVEMTLVLAAERIPITLAREAVVIDPKPPSARGAARQRARWLKGQLHVLRAHPHLVVRILMQGPRGWALLSSALLKPKSLVVPLKILLTLLACLAVDRRIMAALPLAAAGILSLALDAVGLVLGLRFVGDRRKSLQALLFSPAYMGLWLSSLAVAAFSRDPWLRARPVVGRRPEVAPGHASDAPL